MHSGPRKVPVKNRHSNKRYHYVLKKGSWKPKQKFNTAEDAQEYISTLKEKDMAVYKCPFCHKYHIGHEHDK